MTYYQPYAPELIIQPESYIAQLTHQQAALSHPIYYFHHCLGCDIAACLDYNSCDDTTHFHGEWTRFYMEEKFCYICSSRRHIKSTWTQGLAAWEGLRKPQKILVVMNSFPQVKDWMRNFTHILEYSIEQLGLNIEIVKNSVLDGVELSNGTIIYPRSLEQKFRGLSPDIIIIDDLLDKLMKMSFDAAEERFRADILGTRQEHTKVIYVGTIIKEGDVLDKIRLGEIGNYAGNTYPAVLDWETKKVLWPVKRSWDYLMEQREALGEYLFQVEYLLNPLSDELALVPRRIIEKCKDDELPLDRDPLPGSKIVIGVDLQISTSKNADYTVYLGLEVFEDKRFAPIFMDRHRGLRYSAQLDRLEDLDYSYEPDLIIIESNLFQLIFAQMLEDRNDNLKHIIKAENTGKEKHDKQEGVPSLAQVIDKRELVIPWADEYSRERMSIMIDELAAWQYDKDKDQFVSKGRHDDTTMALWQAVKGVRRVAYSRSRFAGVDMAA